MTPQNWHAWATAQIVVCWLGLTAAIGLGLVGGALIGADLADDTDSWHGFGVLVGGVAVTAALFVAAMFEAVRRLTRRGVARAWRGDPHLLRGSAYVGLSGIGVSVLLALHFLGSLGTLSSVFLVPAALLAAPPVGLLLTAPRSPQA